jgi:hypothetical protein
MQSQKCWWAGERSKNRNLKAIWSCLIELLVYRHRFEENLGGRLIARFIVFHHRMAFLSIRDHENTSRTIYNGERRAEKFANWHERELWSKLVVIESSILRLTHRCSLDPPKIWHFTFRMNISGCKLWNWFFPTRKPLTISGESGIPTREVTPRQMFPQGQMWGECSGQNISISHPRRDK